METALKNYTLEEVLQDAESPFLDQFFAQSLNAYKECRGAKKQYKIELLRRLRLRNEMDSLLSQRYKSSVPVIQHFFDADKQVPIWSIFRGDYSRDFRSVLQMFGFACKASDCSRTEHAKQL